MTSFRVSILDTDPAQMAVLGFYNTPPAHLTGRRVVVGTAPTGAFNGHANKIAWSDGTNWWFDQPASGWETWSDADAGHYYFTGSAWVSRAAFVNGLSYWTKSGSDIYYNSGKVGIGTIPSSKLHILSSNLTGIRLHDDTALGRIHVSGSGTGYTHSDIVLQSSQSIRGAGIYTFNNSVQETWYFGNPYGYFNTGWVINRKTGTSDLHPSTAESTAAGVVNLLTVRSSGNVGIGGVTNPSHKLYIYDNSSNGLALDADSVATMRFYRAGVNKWGFLNNHAGTDFFGLYDYTRSAYTLVFKPNSDCYFASGNVGISTANPLQKLHVAAGDINLDTNYGIRINNTGDFGTFLRGNGTRYTRGTIQASDLPSHDHSDAAGWIYDSSNNLIYTSSTDRRVSIGPSALLRDSAFQIYNANRSYAEMLVYTDDANFSDLNVIAVTNYDQGTEVRGLVVNSYSKDAVAYPNLVLAGFTGDGVSGNESHFARFHDGSNIVRGLKINHSFDTNQSIWASYGSLFMDPTLTAIFDIYNYNSSQIPATLRLIDSTPNWIEFKLDSQNSRSEIFSNTSLLLSTGGVGVFVTSEGLGIDVAYPDAFLHIAPGTTTKAPLKFYTGTPGSVLATPQQGAVEWDGTRLYVTNSARQTLAYLKDVGLRASQTAVINATAHLTQTVIHGDSVGASTILANTFAAGDVLTRKLTGVYRTGATTQNITVRVFLNSTQLISVVGNLPATGPNDWNWTGDVSLTIKTTGALGKGLFTGAFFMESRSLGYAVMIPLTVTSEIDINTTQANTVAIDAQWANSGNSLKTIHSNIKLERVN